MEMRRRFGEGRLVQADEVEIARGTGDGFLHRRLHRRLQPAELGQEAIGAEEEHAAVPQILARGEIALGGRGIRLLDEGRHLAAARRIRQGLAAADIAIARLRRAGRDAEGDQRSRLRRLGRLPDRAAEGRGVLDVVVGGQDQQQAVGRGHQGGGRDRRGRVAGQRLEHDRLGLAAQGAELLGDQKTVLVVADQQRAR